MAAATEKRLTAEQLADIMRAGVKAAQHEIETGDTDDGGTCNLDSVALDLTGYRKPTVEQAAALAGVHVYKLSGAWWSGCWMIGTPHAGQGDRRTRCAEAAGKAMTEAGGKVRMYYQCD